MSHWEDELIDDFLADVPDEDLEALGAATLGAASPAPELRARLLASATLAHRFDRFAAGAAELLDVDEATARSLLDGIADPSSWHGSPVPGVELYDLAGGPAVADAIRGFVRMQAGAAFPEHEHLGDETVLVVQGSFEDGVSGEVHRAGDVVRKAAGTRHDFLVRPGPDLVYLVVLPTGVRIGDQVIGPNDPDL